MVLNPKPDTRMNDTPTHPTFRPLIEAGELSEDDVRLYWGSVSPKGKNYPPSTIQLKDDTHFLDIEKPV